MTHKVFPSPSCPHCGGSGLASETHGMPGGMAEQFFCSCVEDQLPDTDEEIEIGDPWETYTLADDADGERWIV